LHHSKGFIALNLHHSKVFEMQILHHSKGFSPHKYTPFQGFSKENERKFAPPHFAGKQILRSFVPKRRE
jgi:hypothetical protein